MRNKTNIKRNKTTGISHHVHNKKEFTKQSKNKLGKSNVRGSKHQTKNIKSSNQIESIKEIRKPIDNAREENTELECNDTKVNDETVAINKTVKRVYNEVKELNNDNKDTIKIQRQLEVIVKVDNDPSLENKTLRPLKTNTTDINNESDLTFIEVKSKVDSTQLNNSTMKYKDDGVSFNGNTIKTSLINTHNTVESIKDVVEIIKLSKEEEEMNERNLVETDEFIVAKYRKVEQMKDLLKSLSY